MSRRSSTTEYDYNAPAPSANTSHTQLESPYAIVLFVHSGRKRFEHDQSAAVAGSNLAFADAVAAAAFDGAGRAV